MWYGQDLQDHLHVFTMLSPCILQTWYGMQIQLYLFIHVTNFNNSKYDMTWWIFTVITIIISGVADKMSGRPSPPLPDIFPIDDWHISEVILVFRVGHFMCCEPCWTKCPARSELSAQRQQKSAGHVLHILRSLYLKFASIFFMWITQLNTARDLYAFP